MNFLLQRKSTNQGEMSLSRYDPTDETAVTFVSLLKPRYASEFLTKPEQAVILPVVEKMNQYIHLYNKISLEVTLHNRRKQQCISFPDVQTKEVFLLFSSNDAIAPSLNSSFEESGKEILITGESDPTIKWAKVATFSIGQIIDFCGPTLHTKVSSEKMGTESKEPLFSKNFKTQ